MKVENIDFNYYNPIKKEIDVLHIQRMPLNRIRLGDLNIWENDDDIIKILNSILKQLNLYKLVNGQIVCHTDSPRYNGLLSEYIFYLEHLNNHLCWNSWINKLLIPPQIIKPKSNRVNNKPLPKNEFYKRQTFDLFTNNTIFEYINPRTGEIVKSDNPNLLNKLNSEITTNRKRNTKIKDKLAKRERTKQEKINFKPDFSKLKFKF